MTPVRRPLLLAGCAFALGVAALVAQGPLPLDVKATVLAQAASARASGWAVAVTALGKAPWVLLAVAAAAILTASAGGVRAAAAAPVAYLLARAADLALRAVIFAPRPDPELVAVASASLSSGLPSTFGLVFGALFGLPFWTRRRGRLASAACILAALVLLVGAASRIVLGGHWPSQMLSSVLLGIALARVALFIVERIGTGVGGASPGSSA